MGIILAILWLSITISLASYKIEAALQDIKEEIKSKK